MQKVLVVEDDLAQRILYEEEISAMGYEVLIANDGPEAVTLVQSEKPDLVILDLMMPRMHGLDCLRKILSEKPNLPIIIHSAYSHYKEDFQSWAAEAYVVKSSDLSELKSAVKRALSTEMMSNFGH